MQAVMHRALLRRGRSGRYHSLLQEMLTAGNQCRVRQKGGKRIMAIFHYTVKIVGRSKGKSIISASAYLNGDVMKNEETGRISYYTSKREVVYTSLMMCENAPQEWQNVPAENIKRFQKSVRYKRADNKEVVLEKFKLTFQKQCLWNEVLKIEKSSDAQLGRSFEFSLPKEWNRQEQIEYTPEEIKLIQDMRRRNPHSGLVVFWVKLMQRGYKRSIPGLYRFLKKQGILAQKLPNPKYIPKPYEQMKYPGQRIQVDVKFVPACCLVNNAKGKKFYQYTAIDEYSRWRYVEAFEEHSTYSSAQFLKHLIQRFPMPIECVQTDNGVEFTKRFSTSGKETLTLFQRTLKELGIQHKLIRPFTPRHNGKVERSHRKDNERFYTSHTFYSFEDFSKQLQTYNRRDYNQFPMRPLGWKSPQTVLREFIDRGVTYV